LIDRVANPPHTPVKNKRSIPSLDGLRALSIFVVIIAHCNWYLPAAIQDSLAFRVVIGNGSLGVAIFFVISGYLITGLLLREFDKTGTVSLKRFYFRRTLRIFPPFYAFLAVVGLLWAMGVAMVGVDLRSFLAAATYTVAYYPGMKMGMIFHSWSLSIEAQFYLLWPLTFLIWHRRQKVVIWRLSSSC
jgi:peptidoglycan/LPS O-acetylase OafA/YrhL